MSASQELMKQLHQKLASKMEKMLESDEVSAAQLNVIRSFLSDNDITCEVETDDAMKRLKDKLQERKDRVRSSMTSSEREEVSNVVNMYGSRED